MKYESFNDIHSKLMARVKAFTDRETDQKLYTPQISNYGGIKIKPVTSFSNYRNFFYFLDLQYIYMYIIMRDIL